MRPDVWRPLVEPVPAEQAVIKAVRRAKLFVFLRLHRHELLDEEFQAELAKAYADKPKGQPPVPPAQLALATILQAYTGVSDDEVIEAAVMDRRSRWVVRVRLGFLGSSTAGLPRSRWKRGKPAAHKSGGG